MTPQQKKQAQLDLREKQLNDKEAYLDNLDKSLDEVKLKLKTLEANIKVREEVIQALIEEHKQLSIKYDKESDDNNKKSQKKKNELTLLESQLFELEQKKQLLKTEIVKLGENRKNIENNIKELKNYQHEQDRLVNEAVENGNAKLLDIKYDLDQLENAKRHLTAEITTLKEEKTDYEYKVALSQVAYETNKDKYIFEQNTLTQMVEELRAEIQQAKEELNQVKMEQKEQLDTLKEKEIAVNAKLDQLTEERHIFETEKRRHNNLNGL